MKKLDIVNNITRKSQIKKNNVSQVVELFLSEIKSALIDVNSVFIRGFGSFTIKKRAKKKARNITKKTSVVVPAHMVPSFKVCKELRRKVSEKTLVNK